MDDMDVVDQIAFVGGELAGLAGQHRRAMDVSRLANDLQAQIAELDRIRSQLIASRPVPTSAVRP